MPTLPSQSTLVNIYNVGVTFDPATDTLSFSGDMPANKVLRIGQGINLIVFDLQTNPPVPGESPAAFVADPIVWLEGTTPPFNQPQRYNDHRFTLLVYNTVLEAVNNEHMFNLTVLYGGVTHSSDPTIINEPPGGG